MMVLAVAVLVAGATAVSAEFRLQRQLALSSGGTLVLDADVGSVTITGGDSASGASPGVTAGDDFENNFTISFDEQPGVATVRVKRRNGWRPHFFSFWFDRGNGAGGNLSSSGGPVRAEVDPRVSLLVDASSSGGGVRVAAAEWTAARP